MLTSYIYACLWGTLIFVACIGWGWFVSLVSPKNKYGLGMLGVFGISFSIIVGGFLDFFQLISPFSVKIYLYLGFILFILFLWNNVKCISEEAGKLLALLKSDKVVSAALFFIVVFLLARIALSVSFYGFHGADDDPGYLAFPHKMIQIGQMGPDPFSERRLVSSLGGKYFLDTFVLSALDYKYLHIIDNCIGYLFFILLVYQLLVYVKINRHIKIFIFILLLVISSPTGNITSVMVSAMLFFGLLLLLFYFSKNRAEVYIVTPLVVAATLVLKSNMIVPTVLVATYYYYLVVRNKIEFKNNKSIKDVFSRVTLYLCLPGLIVLFLMSPWMVSMYHSSGTLLYPILGKGYHGILYGNFLSHYFNFDFYSFVRLIFELYGGLSIFIPLLFLLVAVLVFKVSQKSTLVVLLLTALVSVMALIYGTGGYSLYYYSFPFAVPILLFCLIVINNNPAEVERTKILGLTLLITSFMFGCYVQKGLDVFQEIKNGISFENGFKFGLINTNPVSALEVKQYIALQVTVPAQETIFAVLEKNFLLNFKRNNIYIVDAPGAASFPPGLPMFKGEDALSDYLLSKNIRYVACSCGEKAGFSKSRISGMLKVHVNPWLKTEAMNLIDFRDNFQKLSAKKKVLYNDGINIVIDLATKI